MRIIRPDGSMVPKEAKLNKIRGVIREGVRFKRGILFRAEVSPASTEPNDPEWDVWKVTIAIEGDGPTKRIELDDCLDVDRLPEFAVASSLFTSYGLSGAIGQEVTRLARLTVESMIDGRVSFSLDIGSFHSDKEVAATDVSPMIK